jgi:hypothetical protein
MNDISWPLESSQSSDSGSEKIVYEKNEKAITLVVGTTNLYEDGKLRLIPVSPKYSAVELDRNGALMTSLPDADTGSKG